MAGIAEAITGLSQACQARMQHLSAVQPYINYTKEFREREKWSEKRIVITQQDANEVLKLLLAHLEPESMPSPSLRSSSSETNSTDHTA